MDVERLGSYSGVTHIVPLNSRVPARNSPEGNRPTGPRGVISTPGLQSVRD